MKFGKKPAVRSRKSLSLSNYLHMNQVAFPQVQAWERPIAYGMLGNDEVGDCTIAGADHLEMNWQAVANAGAPLAITTEQALADYSAVTGYDPADPSTDQGANMLDVLNYWKAKGLAGRKIAGFATLDVQNVDQIKAAIYLFGGVYMGFNVPRSVEADPNNKTWRLIPGDSATGDGHCVVPVGYGRSGLAPVSWGAIYHATWDFWLAYVDEAYAVVSPDWIKASGISPTGLDLNGLLQDLAAL